jgi:hypothetical protein
MPKVDKIVWFVVVPLLLPALAFIVPVMGPLIYVDPLFYLFDFWLVTAIATWILRRPYHGWAKIWRRGIVIVGVLALLGRAAESVPEQAGAPFLL